jgi:hypothetical protein
MNSALLVKKADLMLCGAVLLAVLWSIGCGGGSPGGGNVGPQSDFSISTTPTTLTLGLGGSETISVAISPLNGFTGQVNVSLSSLPAGVNASPSSFALSSGSQQVTLTASAAATAGSYTISLQGTSSAGGHTFKVPLNLEVPVTAASAPVRARYRRTNSFYDPNSLQFAPPHFTVYDAAHRQFFVSNPFLNEIDVFDASKELEIGQIAVPFAWGIDISPLDGSLYAGTLLGDVYHIDTGTLAVITRYPSASIGFTATEVFVLADGRLALLGGQGGILGVDGASGIAVWDPTSNSLDTGTNGSVCPILNIGAFAVSGDRTRVLATTVDEGGGGEAVCSYDAATKLLTMGAFPPATFVRQIIPTPDGTRFFLTSNLNGVGVFDAQTVQLLGQITGSSSSTIGLPNAASGAVMSLDGKTLFLVDQGSGAIAAYDTTSLSQTGWIPSFVINDSQSTIVASAIDETGLIVGPTGHGVAFLDASQILSNPPTLIRGGFSAPETGPVSGGTVISGFLVGNVTDSATLSQIYVGNLPGTQASFNTSPGHINSAQATTPPSNQTGAVDLTVTLSDGAVGIAPEGFSFGRTILEVVPNAATAEGGQLGAIIGYGFGQDASGLQVTVGGKSAPVTVLHASAPVSPYPFPAEAFQFTIPPGTAGTTVDVTVTTAFGSATATAAFHYTAATESHPVTANLQSGIYDSHRNLYYFTDQAKIQVLSRSTGWLTPISLPSVTSKTQLLAISESPDGSVLGVSNYGDQTICVLNPDTPSTIKCYAMEGIFASDLAPTGLAITDTGFVYFATNDINGTGTPAFHKLDTGTGAVTDLGAANGLSSGGVVDKFERALLNKDGTRVYGDNEGATFWVDTSNDQIHFSPGTNSLGGDPPEIALSADASTVAIAGFLADASLNPETTPAYIDWETWFPTATMGQKLNADGSVMFQPLTDGVDLIARNSGRLLYRVQVPVAVADVYDSLVAGEPNLIGIITSSGVSFVDVSSLPIPSADSHPFLSVVFAGTTAQGTADTALPPTRKRSLLVQRPQLKRAHRANPNDSSGQ